MNNIFLKNRILRFFSSVKLAIPVIAALALFSIWGTLVEAEYSAEIAKIKVYNSVGFQLTLALLFINILFAALSRYPWKKNHLGFVITHLGLLLLLAGSFVTQKWGIDGQLQVQEGASNGTVFLPQNSITIQVLSSPPQVFSLDKKLEKLLGNDLANINEKLPFEVQVSAYYPFVNPMPRNSDDPDASFVLHFRLKSKFFNVEESIDDAKKKLISMGPATIRIIAEEDLKNKSTQIVSKPQINKKSNSLKISFIDISSGKSLREATPSEWQKSPVVINNVSFQLKNYFQHASIVENKIQENPEGQINEAVEFTAESKGDKKREISYKKFPDFSLNPNGLFGIKIIWVGGEEGHDAHPQDSLAGGEGIDWPSGPTISFVISNDKLVHRVIFSKEQAVVSESPVSLGNIINAPWMGIELTPLKMGPPEGLSPDSIPFIEMSLMPREQTPPSAIELTIPSAENQKVYLVENEENFLSLQGRPTKISYGQTPLELPFKVELLKFQKTDYKGTEMAMEFESLVKVNGQEYRISMNNPLKYQGYTLYQSSYIQNPGSPTFSIFSVNQDPGRWAKYFGSIVLGIGIITYTVMNSSTYRKRRGIGRAV